MRERCDEGKETLPLYIDGEGQQTDEDALLRGIRRTAKTLPGLAVTDDFRASLRDRLKQEAEKPKHRTLPLWKQAAGFAAAAAVVAVSVMTFGNLPEPDVAPPQEITSQATQGEEKPETKDFSMLADTVRIESKSEDTSAGVPAKTESQEASIQPRFTYAAKGVLHYTFDEMTYSGVESLLSNYEFDGEGYKIPVDEIAMVCEKLESLAGYVGHRPASDSPEAETEEEKELFSSFVWIAIEKVN